MLGIHDIDVDGGTDGARTMDAHLECAFRSLGTPAFSSVVVRADLSHAPIAATEWDGTLSGPTGGVVQIFALSGGAMMTPDWPGTLGPRAGLDLGTAKDAGAVLSLDTTGDGTVDTVFQSQAGNLDLTSASTTAGATFAGTLTNAVLFHVDIDPATGAISRFDPDQCIASITSVSFSGTVTGN